MSFDQCEYCGLESNALQAKSSINRHIKNESKKPKEERGNHPGQGTKEFLRIAAIRKFRTKAATPEERKERTAKRNYKYIDKRKITDEKKVEAAFKILP